MTLQINNNLQNKIISSTKLFEPTSLAEMDVVKLMDRVEVKYTIPLHILPELLEQLTENYKILEISKNRLAKYVSYYYDTPDLDCYHNHQNGKLNRYKIRHRNYVNTGISYFEVKFKNNKNRTLKSRFGNEFSTEIDLVAKQFLHANSTLDASQFKNNLNVIYNRITLVHKRVNERVTLDLGLSYENDQQKASFNQLVIIEVKQNKLYKSDIIKILKQKGVKSGAISKYCLGILSFHPGIKQNRFKQKLLNLNKIKQQYDLFASSQPA